jgi:hypothetical protein
VVGAMHVLSELLAETSVDGVDSYSEHDLSMTTVLQIINNLNDFNAKVGGEGISTTAFDSTPANSSFCLDRPLKLTKVCMNLYVFSKQFMHSSSLTVPFNFHSLLDLYCSGN